MDKLVLLSNKNFHFELFNKLKSYHENIKWVFIKDEESFTKENLEKIQPKKFLFPIGLKLYLKKYGLIMNVYYFISQTFLLVEEGVLCKI